MNAAVMGKTQCQGRASASDAIGLHVDRVAQAELAIGENLTPERIEGHVLRGAEQAHRKAEHHDRIQPFARLQCAQGRNCPNKG